MVHLGLLTWTIGARVNFSCRYEHVKYDELIEGANQDACQVEVVGRVKTQVNQYL